MKLHIISAALPPQLDGIGDYTAQLAAELARTTDVTILMGAPTPDPIPGVRVETVFDAHAPRSVWNLVDRVVQDKPDWVLLQYNPFSYGRWGLNLHLPEVLHKLRKQQVKVAVMAHETFTPATNWQSAVMTIWQRWQFWRIRQSANILLFSTDTYAARFRVEPPQTPIIHLPVGSNISYQHFSKADARAKLKIADDTLVFGLFGTMHISRMMDRVKDAVNIAKQSTEKILVIYIGPHGSAVSTALNGIPLLIAGVLDDQEISRHFAAMDIYLTPFSDGISTRRTTVMCGLQHGVALVGTQGYNTDMMLQNENGQSFLLANASNPREFSENVRLLVQEDEKRHAIAQNGRQFFLEHFTWARIGEQLKEVLNQHG